MYPNPEPISAFPTLSEIWRTRYRYDGLNTVFIVAIAIACYLVFTFFKFRAFSGVEMISLALVGIGLTSTASYVNESTPTQGPLFALRQIYNGLFFALMMGVLIAQSGVPDFAVRFIVSGGLYALVIALTERLGWGFTPAKQKARAEYLALAPGSVLDGGGMVRLAVLGWPVLVLAATFGALALWGVHAAVFSGAAVMALAPAARKVDPARLNPAMARVSRLIWWVLTVDLVVIGAVLLWG